VGPHMTWTVAECLHYLGHVRASGRTPKLATGVWSSSTVRSQDQTRTSGAIGRLPFQGNETPGFVAKDVPLPAAGRPVSSRLRLPARAVA
jgi:hypothetical protein